MMFFFLSIAAMLGYSIYGTLIAHHVRKHDGLSVATVRNLSLAIIMIPLLFFADSSNFSKLSPYILTLVSAGLTGIISMILTYWSLRFLPVGIKTALGRIGSVIFIFLISWIWFGEIPTILECIWILPIVIGGSVLSLQTIKFSILDGSIGIGVLLNLIGVIFTSISFVQMSDVARNLDPFIAGYFWEVLIGAWALLFGIGRWMVCGKPIFGKIKLPEAGKIALVSAPTLIGTGCFALAVTMGPVGIANVIGTGGIFVSILMGYWLYHEKMTRTQWLWIGVSVAGLIGLGLS